MEVGDLRDLPAWAHELLVRSPVGRLAYLDDRDRPRVLPVTFALARGKLWTAIDRKPKARPPERIARVRYLRRRAEAALCVDHYEDDWSRLAWVQALGSVAVVELERAGAEGRGALSALRAKYDAYRDEPPDGPLLALRPHRVLCWRAAGDEGA
jgi:PPOX class probable F420-dependent enzyme